MKGILIRTRIMDANQARAWAVARARAQQQATERLAAKLDLKTEQLHRLFGHFSAWLETIEALPSIEASHTNPDNVIRVDTQDTPLGPMLFDALKNVVDTYKMSGPFVLGCGEISFGRSDTYKRDGFFINYKVVVPE